MRYKKLKDLLKKKTKFPIINIPFIQNISNTIDPNNKCFGCPNYGKNTACWCIIGGQGQITY